MHFINLRAQCLKIYKMVKLVISKGDVLRDDAVLWQSRTEKKQEKKLLHLQN